MRHASLASDDSKQELVRTITSLNTDLERHMAASGSDAWMDLQNITVKQLKVMLILSQQHPVTVTALAERLRVHISTVTGILDRLVQQGLVKREEDPADRRHVVSRLTPDGERVLHRLYYGVGQEDLTKRLESLDEADLQALERGLRALVGAW
jgi:DNA-binding MarR family transcriptional regulator